jgi:hypothetical protein
MIERYSIPYGKNRPQYKKKRNEKKKKSSKKEKIDYIAWQIM